MTFKRIFEPPTDDQIYFESSWWVSFDLLNSSKDDKDWLNTKIAINKSAASDLFFDASTAQKYRFYIHHDFFIKYTLRSQLRKLRPFPFRLGPVK